MSASRAYKLAIEVFFFKLQIARARSSERACERSGEQEVKAAKSVRSHTRSSKKSMRADHFADERREPNACCRLNVTRRNLQRRRFILATSKERANDCNRKQQQRRRCAKLSNACDHGAIDAATAAAAIATAATTTSTVAYKRRIR